MPSFDKWGSATAGLFIVEIDGRPLGRFREISGLQIDIDVETYTEGGENGFAHKLPGRMTWPNLVLKGGVTEQDPLLKWLHDSVGDGMARRNGQAQRTTAAIVLMSTDGDRLRSWNVVDAFPVRWGGPTLASGVGEMADEELEIAHHGFRVG